MNRLLVLFFVSASASTAAAQDFDKAKKSFREAVGAMDASGARATAFEVAKADSREAVDTLLDGYGVCAAQIRQLWTEKQKCLQEVKKYENFEVDWTKNPPIVEAGDVAEYKKWQDATAAGQAVERKIMSVDGVKRGIVEALATFKSDTSVKELVSRMKSDGVWTRRAGIAEALGQIAHALCVPTLVDRLKGDSEPGVKVACLDALRTAKATTPDAVIAIADALKNEYWQVKSAAVTTLKFIPRALGAAAIEPLIDALKSADGRLKGEINDALVALTGVDKHSDAASWRAWFDANKDAVRKGEIKPGDAAPRDGVGMTTTFYGIPVKSKNVIFVLDRSGSMSAKSEWELPPPDVATGGGAAGPAIKPDGDRKIDIARWQLKRCLAQLVDGIEFNIVFYNHEWKIMAEGMLKLSASTRKQAFEFIDKVDPVGGTNIFDPTEKAFAFAGATEKLVRSGVDTIFLMTDGMPNSGQVPKAEDIVVKLREMNRAKKLIINTVGVFSAGEADEGAKFLKQLAEESGGVYVSAMKAKK